MLNNVENKIKNAFSNSEIKVNSNDILDKIKSKKVRKFSFNKALGIGLSSFALTAVLLGIVLLPKDDGIESISDKVQSKQYSLNLVAAANTFTSLDVDEQKFSADVLSNNYSTQIVLDAYKNFESTAIAKINEEKVDIVTKEFNDEFDNVEYEYVSTISYDLFNEKMMFYYNIDEETNILTGVLKEDSENLFDFFSIGVESTFTFHEGKQYSNTIYTPRVFGFDIPYSYQINENVDGSTSYNYYFGEESDEPLFGFDIKKDEEVLNIVYRSIYKVVYNFTLEKESENIYNIDFIINELFYGKMKATYDLTDRSYELAFVSLTISSTLKTESNY